MSSEDDNNGWGKPVYKVGYGKPPKEHQFKKGQSGNSKGRRPRTKNASKLLAIELDELIVVRDGNREKRITKREALFKALVNDAITNKPNARPLLVKLLDISPPAEPFTPTEDDDALIEEFLAHGRARQKGGTSDGQSE